LQNLINKIFWLLKQTLATILKLMRMAIKPVAYSALGGFVVLLVLAIVFLNSKPDLFAWHTTVLDQEFSYKMGFSRFDEYLEQEDKLFRQLDTLIKNDFVKYDRSSERGRFNRYAAGSLSSPERWVHNWNRTSSITLESPQAAVLLLHGMSDSPYSMRNLALGLKQQGMASLSLRLPGHGTLPSGLVGVKWEDMAAAVELAVVHLKQQYPEIPLYIIGYSNGATLALNYAMDAASGGLPQVDKMVFLSPSVRVSSFAMLAIWQSRIAHLLGLKKLEWQNVMLEFDPYKYGSFAINAGDQVYRLTGRIARRFRKLAANGQLVNLPQILAFQSVVDDTVSAPAVVKQLFLKLPTADNRLVLLDLNREADAIGLLKNSPSLSIAKLFERTDLNFELDLLTNITPHTLAVELRRKLAGGVQVEHIAEPLTWPNNLFSLSHIALPFPPTDPLYGNSPAEPSPGVSLGDLEFKGERSVLAIPGTALMRLRWNPFYFWMEEEITEFLTPVTTD